MANGSVVLCSGGLNSAVLLALARDAGPCTVIHARYAHPSAEREAQVFGKLATHYEQSDALVIDLPHVAAFARLRGHAPPTAGETAANHPPPGVITTLLGAAGTLAASIDAAKIWIGLCEGGPARPENLDECPEQTREFAQLIEHTLALICVRQPLTLETPLIDLTRGDVVRLAQRLEVPLKLTWSCHAGGEDPCRTCPGCLRRARAFLDAATPDPAVAAQSTPTPTS